MLSIILIIASVVLAFIVGSWLFWFIMGTAAVILDKFKPKTVTQACVIRYIPRHVL
jgi:hypothetical protein